MWENLLSGAIGSIIGVIGAVVVAFWTVERNRRDLAELAVRDRLHQEQQAQRQHQVVASGVLAYHLVELYDELKALHLSGRDVDDRDLADVRRLGRQAVRSIVVDAPLMTPAVVPRMKSARKDIASLTTAREGVTIADLGRVRASVRDAAESLRTFREL